MSTDAIQSIVLGIIQGLGEFLPISSTAHLVLAPYFFSWKDPGLSFDVALHLGTLIAVLIYFWEDWKLIIEAAFKKGEKESISSFEDKYSKDALSFIIVATIPGILTGYFLNSWAEDKLRNPFIIAASLFIFGLLLFLSDRYSKKKKNIKNLSLKEVIIIGVSQAISIIPGVSRSGSTITAGMFLGLTRVQAAKFSFLLSTPIILGAAILEVPNLLIEGMNINIFLGVIFSTLSGYLAIKYLIKYIEKISYEIFFWYRALLAFLIIIFSLYFLK